eukprot:16445206-Heterocapsa_arctica.AAC.1
MRPELPGWHSGPQEAGKHGGPGDEINARKESDTCIDDMARRWLKTSAHIWDGIRTPCWCGDFDLLHHRQPKEANGEDATIVQCTQQEWD